MYIEGLKPKNECFFFNVFVQIFLSLYIFKEKIVVDSILILYANFIVIVYFM